LFRTILFLPVTKYNTHGCESYRAPEIIKYDPYKFLAYTGDLRCVCDRRICPTRCAVCLPISGECPIKACNSLPNFMASHPILWCRIFLFLSPSHYRRHGCVIISDSVRRTTFSCE
jgi:hypothetical protein